MHAYSLFKKKKKKYFFIPYSLFWCVLFIGGVCVGSLCVHTVYLRCLCLIPCTLYFLCVVYLRCLFFDTLVIWLCVCVLHLSRWKFRHGKFKSVLWRFCSSLQAQSLSEMLVFGFMLNSFFLLFFFVLPSFLLPFLFKVFSHRRKSPSYFLLRFHISAVRLLCYYWEMKAWHLLCT